MKMGATKLSVSHEILLPLEPVLDDGGGCGWMMLDGRMLGTAGAGRSSHKCFRE